MLTMNSPASCILVDYYATHIMNFITADKAYCLFPTHTVVNKMGHLTRQVDHPKIISAIAKYEERGWEISGYRDTHFCEIGCPLHANRRIGDKYTWTIDLMPDEEKDEYRQLMIRKVELSSFGLSYHRSHLIGADPHYDFPYPGWPSRPTDWTPMKKDAEFRRLRGVMLEVSMEMYKHPLLQGEYAMNSFNSKWKQFLTICLEEKRKQLLWSEACTDQD